MTLRTGIAAADGHEAVLTEYLCDWPDGCGDLAEHVMGVAPDVGISCAVCHEHAAALQKRTLPPAL